MKYDKCTNCGEYGWVGSHVCKPLFSVAEIHLRDGEDPTREKIDEALEDAVRLRARDAEDAAEKWAERDDSYSAEYRIVSGRHTPIVAVRDSDGEVSVFEVTGEAVPHYYAEERSIKATEETTNA